MECESTCARFWLPRAPHRERVQAGSGGSAGSVIMYLGFSKSLAGGGGGSDEGLQPQVQPEKLQFLL